MTKQSHFDVIILGGGAAGLMCAMTAGQRGKKVLVLECANKLGKKILMSGGGRCNFTNLEILPENFLSNNPHFFKSALNQYTQWDFISMVAKHDITYHEKELGQLFCDDSAKQIVAMLEKECAEVDVSIKLDAEVTKINHEQAYQVSSSAGEFTCDSLVVATGGLSIPTLGGATGFGYSLAEQFNLPIIERVASLVPMTLSDKWHDIAKELSGVSLPVSVSVPSKSFSSDMLFTHRGISGPAVLQLSNYWKLGEEIEIDLLPNQSQDDFYQRLLKTKEQHPKLLIKTYLSNFLPNALVPALLEDFFRQLAGKTQGTAKAITSSMYELKKSDLELLSTYLSAWKMKPSGTEGYRTAEVTKGGVDVNYLSSKTMQVNEQEGLFFIGEVVDVTGHLGGYNFQWAWSSGYVAGMNV